MSALRQKRQFEMQNLDSYPLTVYHYLLSAKKIHLRERLELFLVRFWWHESLKRASGGTTNGELFDMAGTETHIAGKVHTRRQGGRRRCERGEKECDSGYKRDGLQVQLRYARGR